MPYQKILAALRKEGRAQEEEKEIEERIRRASQADIIEQTQAELVAERLVNMIKIFRHQELFRFWGEIC